jgi:cytochrome c2
MDSFEINKILGALLGTCLVLVAIHIAAGTIFAPPVPAKPGYEIAVEQKQPTQPKAEAPAPAVASFDNLLATASVERGAQVAKQCQACHNLGKGEGNKIGPDLYGVVGRPVASVPDFKYSDALKGKGGTWTFAPLNKWLTNPGADVPGTAMTFAGISSEKQRADVIAYLNSNSDKPLPLPKAAQAAAANKPPTAAAKPPEAAPAKPPAAASFDNLLATASVKRGAQTAKQCEICHNLGKGQGNKIGPDLYGVVGRPVASLPGFSYSDALKAKGGAWTFAALNTWLTNPTADVSGTAMTFAGISSEKQRADVIAYLNSNSDKPLPLPKAAEAAPAAPPAAAAKPPAAAPAKPPAAAPIENLLATASIQQGAQIAKQCEICHNLGKGQGNKIGPDLYGVVGRPVASVPGFSYSDALKAKGGAWTFAALNTWLTNPTADVSGTAMTFAGISSEKQRADVIAYLNSNSDKPLPLPKAAPSQPAPAPAPANPPAPAAANPPAAAPANPSAAAPSNPPASAPPAEPNAQSSAPPK